jgi:hypothetical protein
MSNTTKKIKSILQKMDDESVLKLNQKQIEYIVKNANLYGGLPVHKKDRNEYEYLVYSISNLEEEFHKNLTITAFIGYLNAVCDNYHTPDGMPNIPTAELMKDPTLIDKATAKWNKEDKRVLDAIEQHKATQHERNIIKTFLDELFTYNPNRHVSHAYVPNPRDVSRKVLNTKAAKEAIAARKKKDKSFADDMFAYEVGQLKAVTMDTVVHPGIQELINRGVFDPSYVASDGAVCLPKDKLTDEELELVYYTTNSLPSADLFYKFRQYVSNHYESLLRMTQYLYAYKPILRTAIIPYSTFRTVDDAKKFISKHADTTMFTLNVAKMNHWSVLEDLESNKASIIIDSGKTRILEKILEKRVEDSKIASDIVAGKITREKLKSIQENGPDADIMKAMKTESELVDNAITLSQIQTEELEREAGFMQQALDQSMEVAVHSVDSQNNFSTRTEHVLMNIDVKK